MLRDGVLTDISWVDEKYVSCWHSQKKTFTISIFI